MIPDIEGHSKNICLKKTNKIKKGSIITLLVLTILRWLDALTIELCLYMTELLLARALSVLGSC